MNRKGWTLVELLIVLVIIGVLLTIIIGGLGSCSGIGSNSLTQSIKHAQSNWTGLNRQVTLYTNDGKIIKQWIGKYNIEENGGFVRFIDKGKVVTISGTVLIEEQ